LRAADRATSLRHQEDPPGPDAWRLALFDHRPRRSEHLPGTDEIELFRVLEDRDADGRHAASASRRKDEEPLRVARFQSEKGLELAQHALLLHREEAVCPHHLGAALEGQLAVRAVGQRRASLREASVHSLVAEPVPGLVGDGADRPYMDEERIRRNQPLDGESLAAFHPAIGPGGEDHERDDALRFVAIASLARSHAPYFAPPVRRGKGVCSFTEILHEPAAAIEGFKREYLL